jgi:hypothetical protein
MICTRPEWRNGIRSGFKNHRPKGIAGSNPASGTWTALWSVPARLPARLRARGRVRWRKASACHVRWCDGLAIRVDDSEARPRCANVPVGPSEEGRGESGDEEAVLGRLDGDVQLTTSPAQLDRARLLPRDHRDSAADDHACIAVAIARDQPRRPRGAAEPASAIGSRQTNAVATLVGRRSPDEVLRVKRCRDDGLSRDRRPDDRSGLARLDSRLERELAPDPVRRLRSAEPAACKSCRCESRVRCADDRERDEPARPCVRTCSSHDRSYSAARHPRQPVRS